MKFSFKDFFSKCDQTHRKVDLITITEEILNGKLHFLCSPISSYNFLFTNVHDGVKISSSPDNPGVDELILRKILPTGHII